MSISKVEKMKTSKINNFIIKNIIAKSDEEKGEVQEDFTANPFLVPFFNFFYYIAIVPFKTELDKENNKYKLKTHLIHQAVCAVFHLGALVFVNVVTLDGFKYIRSDDSFSIVAIFDCGINFFTSIYTALLVYMVWLRRDQYLQVIENTRVIFKSSKKLRITHMLVQVGFVLVLIIFGLLDWLMIKENMVFGPLGFIYGETHTFDSYHNRQTVSINKSINSAIDKNIGCSDNNSLVRNTSDINTSDYLMILRVSLLYSIQLFLFQFYIFCQLVFLMLAMSLRNIGKQFNNDLLESCFGRDGVKQGIQRYQKLKSITDIVRNIYGNALLAYYLSAVAYYAEAPHTLWGRRGETQKVIMVYFVVSGVIWLIAAEFHYDVKSTLLNWIDFHINLDATTSDHRMRLHIISGEITFHDSNTVALSNKCFPVTYSHLGSMLGLVVTYGIIVFQLHQSQDKQLN